MPCTGNCIFIVLCQGPEYVFAYRVFSSEIVLLCYSADSYVMTCVNNN